MTSIAPAAPASHVIINQQGELIAEAGNAAEAEFLAKAQSAHHLDVRIIPVESLVSITGFIDDEDDESFWESTDRAETEALDYFRILCEDYSQARHEVKVQIIEGNGEGILKEWVRDIDGAPDGPCPGFAGYCNEWN